MFYLRENIERLSIQIGPVSPLSKHAVPPPVLASCMELVILCIINSVCVEIFLLIDVFLNTTIVNSMHYVRNVAGWGVNVGL